MGSWGDSSEFGVVRASMWYGRERGTGVSVVRASIVVENLLHVWYGRLAQGSGKESLLVNYY